MLGLSGTALSVDEQKSSKWTLLDARSTSSVAAAEPPYRPRQKDEDRTAGISEETLPGAASPVRSLPHEAYPTAILDGLRIRGAG